MADSTWLDRCNTAAGALLTVLAREHESGLDTHLLRRVHEAVSALHTATQRRSRRVTEPANPHAVPTARSDDHTMRVGVIVTPSALPPPPIAGAPLGGCVLGTIDDAPSDGVVAADDAPTAAVAVHTAMHRVGDNVVIVKAGGVVKR